MNRVVGYSVTGVAFLVASVALLDTPSADRRSREIVPATCETQLGQLGARKGDAFLIDCPRKCRKEGGPVWGTDKYAGESAICPAAIHAGVIAKSGGVVKIKVKGGKAKYSGSRRNGIVSSSLPNYDRSGLSFTVKQGPADPLPEPPVATPPPPPVHVEPTPFPATCNTRGSQLGGTYGDRIVVDCPSNCWRGARVWGSDVYTADSSVCRAALHNGAIGGTGGRIEVELRRGRRSYAGSRRNQIKTHHYGAWRMSFVVRPMVAAAPAQPPTPPPPLAATCSTTGAETGGSPGETMFVDCPSNCWRGGRVYGSDLYSASSSICRAALHSGTINGSGGVVKVKFKSGRRSYPGSRRNQIKSWYSGPSPISFTVKR